MSTNVVLRGVGKIKCLLYWNLSIQLLAPLKSYIATIKLIKMITTQKRPNFASEHLFYLVWHETLFCVCLLIKTYFEKNKNK